MPKKAPRSPIFASVLSSYLLVYTFIFVVEFIVVATLGAAADKGAHLVLIKSHRAGIGIGILVVIVVLTALAGGGVVSTVF